VTVNGNLTVKNSTVRVGLAPYGPYGADGLRVDISGTVYEGVFPPVAGVPPPSSMPRLRVHTVISGNTLYALDYDSGLPFRKYGMARGFTDMSQIGTLIYKAQYAGMIDSGTPMDFADDVYGPLRIDGYYVRFGEKLLDRPIFQWQGLMNNVLIGTQTVAAGPPDLAMVFLQVGDPGDGTEAVGVWKQFSSRDFKTAITPFGPDQYKNALDTVGGVRLVQFRFKRELESQALHVGMIAEDAPQGFASSDRKAIRLSDTMAYLAAAMKELHTRNRALETRIAALEKRKADLETHAPLSNS
jgi:hypothetical protein